MIFSKLATEELDDLIGKLEIIYAPLINADEYHSCSVEEVVDSVFSYLETFDETQEAKAIEEVNENAKVIMQMISFLVHKVKFLSETVIVFDNFPNVKEISYILFGYTKLSIKDKTELEEYKKFLALLTHVDTEWVEFRSSLSFRVLKLIFLMTLFHAVFYTSILAKLCLHQIALSLGIPA